MPESFGKKVYDNLHYNQQKNTYKVVEINLTEDGAILILREGEKGDKSSRKSIAISLNIAEITHLQKVLDEIATFLVRKAFR